MPTYRLSYYPWITQHVPIADIHREIGRFAAEVEKALADGSTVPVLSPLEVDEQIDQLVSGGSEIALMNPLGYVFARRRPGSTSLSSVAIALRIIDGKVGDTYFAQLYTRNTSALRKDDLSLGAKVRGRSIGYGVPYSTSNFLVPAFALKEQLKVHPFTAFSRVEFLGGHDLVAKAVYEGRVDIGAGHDGVIIDLANQFGFGDAKEKLTQIVRSAPIPSDPIVVRTADAAERKRLQAALVAAGGTPAGKEALERFWGLVKGLKEIEANTYDGLSEIMTVLGLEEDDLLRETTVTEQQNAAASVETTPSKHLSIYSSYLTGTPVDRGLAADLIRPSSCVTPSPAPKVAYGDHNRLPSAAWSKELEAKSRHREGAWIQQ